MAGVYDKNLLHKILTQPIKLFGKTKISDKIDALDLLKSCADLSDIEYIFPLVFDESIEIASAAASVSAGIMSKVQGKVWNKVYDIVKYTHVELISMDRLLKFPEDIPIHLLGIASLNSNGYIREKSLRNFSKVSSSSAIPYILLRLNDWVLPVRIIAEYTLKSLLTVDNVDAFIDNSYLIDRLQNVLRVDPINTMKFIEDYLSDDSIKSKIKNSLRHPQVKARLFSYMLLKDSISKDGDIINSALKDKSFEIRMWLVEAIKKLDSNQKAVTVGKLLKDKSAKVVTAVLRCFEDIICLEYKDVLVKLVTGNHASVRDEARFIAKKHSLIRDFPEYYRKLLAENPIPGTLAGLGETGCKSDFPFVSSFYTSENAEIKLAAITAMWYISKDEAIKYVLKEVDSDIPKIKKTARKIILGSRMPHVIYEMKTHLKSEKSDIKLFALFAIYRYGGWHALEAILCAVCYWKGPEADKAKCFLDNWLSKSVSLNTSPERTTYSNITELFEQIKCKRLISVELINELNFFFETRRLGKFKLS